MVTTFLNKVGTTVCNAQDFKYQTQEAIIVLLVFPEGGSGRGGSYYNINYALHLPAVDCDPDLASRICTSLVDAGFW